MVNKVILIGNVGTDPEVRAMEGGVKVARLRLATTERYRDRQSNENKEHTEWHTVTLWRGLADVVDNYVRKGSQIYIEGRLRTREWTDQQGQKRYTTEILADAMNLLGRRSDNGQVADNTGTYTAAPRPAQSQQPAPQPVAQPTYQAPQQPVATPQEDPDDLPF
ncbi:MAG: single-stranded DNA-binding protein [Alistipes sp.]|nr:single-stranded DNA-binding protein [Alistipes sp.]